MVEQWKDILLHLPHFPKGNWGGDEGAAGQTLLFPGETGYPLTLPGLSPSDILLG